MSSLLRLACRVGNLIQPIRSTTQILVLTRHQYGISALVSQTSFGGETSGSVLGHEVFSPERSLNQPKAKRVCIRSINQSNRFISVLFARFHLKVVRKWFYFCFTQFGRGITV